MQNDVKHISLNNKISFFLLIDTYAKTSNMKFRLEQLVSRNLHWRTKLKDQPALIFSCFKHNFSINERKNLKLIENICYETMN